MLLTFVVYLFIIISLTPARDLKVKSWLTVPQILLVCTILLLVNKFGLITLGISGLASVAILAAVVAVLYVDLVLYFYIALAFLGVTYGLNILGLDTKLDIPAAISMMFLSLGLIVFVVKKSIFKHEN